MKANAHPLVFLIGMMGSGKSTVGAALARKIGGPFVDLDRAIERETGKSVTQLFSEGEPTFRETEERLLHAVAAVPSVIAVGGGTPCFGDNLRFIKSRGLVVYLETSPATLAQRLGAGEGRPLLAGAENVQARVTQLLSERRDAYEAAHRRVVTDARSIEAVVDEVAREVAAWAFGD